MSARIPTVIFLLLTAVQLLLPKSSPAVELSYPFTDPLATLPTLMGKGEILPGDSAAVSLTLKNDFSRPLSLGEALDLALSNNQNIKRSWADIKIQAGVLGEAAAAFLPTLSGGVSFTKDYIFSFDANSSTTQSNSFTAQASVIWRIFDFGGRSANRSSAEKLLASALASHDVALQDAAGRAIKAYFDALIATASLTAKVKDEEIARHTLNSAKVREEIGAISQLDTLRAATALSRASLDRSRAHSEHQKALAALKRALGVPESTALLLPAELGEQLGGEVESRELNLWVEEAQKSHPSIVKLKKQYEAAQEMVTVAKSAGLPDVSVSGNYYMNTRPGQAVNPGTHETTFVINMNIPLFDGFATTYKVRGAQGRVERSRADLSDMEEQVATDIARAYADTNSARQNLESSATLISQAQSALAVSQRRYDNGVADITDVLGTQAAMADALNERVRCLAEWQSARLQLLVSSGRFGRRMVKN